MVTKAAVWAAAVLPGCFVAQLLGPNSPWVMDRSLFQSGDPFIERFGNAPTVCRNTTGDVVPCEQIHVLAGYFMNTGPLHICYALLNGMKITAHWINQEQYMLPGYELVFHVRDTEWTAEAKDRIMADELLNESNPIKYAGSISAFNLDGGYVYQHRALRLPLLTGAISQIMEDADRMPGALTPVNHAGHTVAPIIKVFQKCNWKRIGIIVDPVQFGFEATHFKAKMEAEGYTVDFYAELTRLTDLPLVLSKLRQHRSRVVYMLAEAVPFVWLVCGMKLERMGRVLVMQWPGIPWFLNAADAQDDSCKNPAVLVEQMVNQYIGWYPITMDGSPDPAPLTCWPNKPKIEAQQEILSFLGSSLAAAGAPFGAVAHMSGGADLSCLFALYLQHMIFNKSRTVEEISSRTEEIYQEYLEWAWPDFHGLSGHIAFERNYNAKGDFTGTRLTNIEIVQITGPDFTKSPYFNVPPPWDIGMIWPNYERKRDGTLVEGFVDNLVFEDGAACPADHFPDCPTGQELLWGHCVPCEKGFALGSSGSCEPCREGYFQSTEGQTVCVGCPLGRFSNATGQSECTQCESGYHRPSGTPSTQCLPCSPGRFSNSELQSGESDMEHCLQCSGGTYTSLGGSTRCESCPVGLTTEGSGGESLEACRCPEGQYEDATGCHPCPEGTICAFGSTPDSIILEKGYWSSESEPLSVYTCGSFRHCPGGPPSNPCGEHMHKQGCSHCTDGYIMLSDECVKCSPFEKSAFLFPILPIVCGAPVICFMYWLSGADVIDWKHWSSGLAGVGFVLLNHYQMVSLLQVSDQNAPPEVSDTMDTWKFASDVISVFRPPCSGVSGFMEALIIKSLGPILVWILFFLVAAASHVVARVVGMPDLAMKRYRVESCYFSVIFAFFAAIAQAAFTVTNCVPNPSDTWTLNVDRSVVCFDDDWIGMLLVGLGAVLFWCVGFGALFTRAVYVAPLYFDSLEFRLRWKFLFLKFRPACFGFSLVIVLKGIITNVGFIFLSEPLLQVYWTVACLAFYCGLVGLFNPWRNSHINAVDVCAHLSLIFLGFMMTWFIAPSSNMDSVVNILSIVVSFLTALFSIFWTVRMIVVQVAKSHLEKRARDTEAIRSAIEVLASTRKDTYDRFMDELIDYDFYAFQTVAKAIPAALSAEVAEATKLSGNGKTAPSFEMVV